MKRAILFALDMAPFLLLPAGLFVYLLLGEQVTLSQVAP